MVSIGADPGATQRRWWTRELRRYPNTRVRYASLAVVALATVVLYYQLYLSGGVAVEIIGGYGLSFRWFVFLNVAGLVIAGLAAHFGGFADRFGRANLITVGLVVVGLLSAVAVPLCHDRWSFAVVFCALNAAEGVILVATPAVVRDFSPQLGRASAMGFWTMGPILGSLSVTAVVGSGTGSVSWQGQYIAAGCCGLVVAMLSLPLLKELPSALRDQIVIESADVPLVEARSRHGAVPSFDRPSRQMFKPDIVLPSIANALLLLFYVSMVAFGPTYFEVNFGYSQAEANSVLAWGWGFLAVSLVLTGWASDKLMVRKPLMLLGAIGTAVMIVVFLERATHPETSHATFAAILAVMLFFTGMAYVAWMAAFTETVERRNPALVASGLAVWGLTIRAIFALFVISAPFVVSTVGTIVDQGPKVLQIASGQSSDLTRDQNAVVAAVGEDPSIVERVKVLADKYSDQLKTAAAIDPATRQALMANPADAQAGATATAEIAKTMGVPTDRALAQLQALGKVPKADLAFVFRYGTALKNSAVIAKLRYLQAHGPAVLKARTDGPRQWEAYFWIAAAGAAGFIPMIWMMAGYWNPRNARRALRDHETAVARETAEAQA